MSVKNETSYRIVQIIIISCTHQMHLAVGFGDRATASLHKYTVHEKILLNLSVFNIIFILLNNSFAVIATILDAILKLRHCHDNSQDFPLTAIIPNLYRYLRHLTSPPPSQYEDHFVLAATDFTASNQIDHSRYNLLAAAAMNPGYSISSATK